MLRLAAVILVTSRGVALRIRFSRNELTHKSSKRQMTFNNANLDLGAQTAAGSDISANREKRVPHDVHTCIFKTAEKDAYAKKRLHPTMKIGYLYE